ncbi:MAG: ERF family protein [Candidatus Aquicultorales bacterium]
MVERTKTPEAPEKLVDVTPQAPSGPRPINLYKALLGVASEIEEVEKANANKEQHYNYASEADFIREVRPKLLKAGVLMLPSVVSCETELVPRVNENGIQIGNREYAHVTIEALFIHVESGETLSREFVGGGVDPNDKAIPKACTMALKYAIRQSLMIPTGDDPDAGGRGYDREDADEITAEQTKLLAEIKAEPTKGSQVVIDFLPRSYNKDNPMDLWTMVHEDRKTVAYLRDKGRQKFIREAARLMIEAYPAPEGEETNGGSKAVMIHCPACNKPGAAYDNREAKLAGKMKVNAPNLSCSTCGYKKWPTKDETESLEAWIALGRQGDAPALSIEAPDDESQGVQETLT